MFGAVLVLLVSRNALTAFLLASTLIAERLTAQSQAARPTFAAEEATISGIQAALAAGLVTCVQVVQAHLRRIEAYDDRGPALNALITVNRRALDTAAELDRVRNASRSSVRPLDCIPVILKDNYDTADMPTTGGSITLAESVPLRDAFVVRKLREAGAIILAVAEANSGPKVV